VVCRKDYSGQTVSDLVLWDTRQHGDLVVTAKAQIFWYDGDFFLVSLIFIITTPVGLPGDQPDPAATDKHRTDAAAPL
jgi:hypothetical protein